MGEIPWRLPRCERADVLPVSENATRLVRLRGDQEIGAIDLRLAPEEVTVLRPRDPAVFHRR